MAIPAKQIGSSYEANLLWQIAKQLEQLSKVTGNNSNVTVDNLPLHILQNQLPLLL